MARLTCGEAEGWRRGRGTLKWIRIVTARVGRGVGGVVYSCYRYLTKNTVFSRGDKKLAHCAQGDSYSFTSDNGNIKKRQRFLSFQSDN